MKRESWTFLPIILLANLGEQSATALVLTVVCISEDKLHIFHVAILVVALVVTV